LALYEAEQALSRDLPPEALAEPYRALLRYRDTEEGRSFAGVNETAAELALRLGDSAAARGYWDADRRGRAAAARPLRARMNAALRRGELAQAGKLLEDLRRLAPSDLGTLRASAALARRRGDHAAFEAALAEVERWAPSPRHGRFEAQRIRLLNGGAGASEPGSWPASGATRDDRG
jgi:hypothetical protein